MTNTYKGSRFIKDINTMNHLENLSLSLGDIVLSNFNEEYLFEFRKWINSTTINTIKGFDAFTHADFCHGTTEAFDKFYTQNHTRRLRIFKADYAYHKFSHNNYEFLEDDVLRSNDAIIISLPFSDTGDEFQYEDILQIAERFNLPVLVDCCWFGTCSNVTFDFSYSCITTITFSLSKSFPVSRFRIGIRFTKDNFDDGLTAYTRDNYVNTLSQYIGISFMKAFSPDYIPTKYKEKQASMCKAMRITPSKVVFLGLGDAKWSSLNRGGEHNRLCLSDFFID